MTDNLMITISRECGSGGHEIGRMLAKKLGINVYDNEILTIAAKETGYDPSVFEAAEQKHTNAISMAIGVLSSERVYNMPLDNRLFNIQSSIIKTIADRESAVIVGRCADAVLDDYTPCVHIFIQGSEDIKAERVAKRQNMLKADAREYMKRTDKSRATYYNFYTDRKWGSRENYDIIINSDIGLEETTEILADYINKLQKK